MSYPEDDVPKCLMTSKREHCLLVLGKARNDTRLRYYVRFLLCSTYLYKVEPITSALTKMTQINTEKYIQSKAFLRLQNWIKNSLKSFEPYSLCYRNPLFDSIAMKSDCGKEGGLERSIKVETYQSNRAIVRKERKHV